jgi:hypothetical protein
MRRAIPLLPQYAFIAWCSVKEKAEGQLYVYLYPMDSRLGGPQSRSGRDGNRIKLCPRRESKPGSTARSLVTILTELSRLLVCVYEYIFRFSVT